MIISVIVPSYNRARNLYLTLTCLIRQQMFNDTDSFEIIVVDDCSTDGTSEMLFQNFERYNFVHVIRTREHKGWNAAIPRNIGASHINPESIGMYFVDSDVILPPDRVQVMINNYKKLSDPNRVIIGPYHFLNNEIDAGNDPEWYTKEIRNFAQDVRWESFNKCKVDETHTGISFALACFSGNIFIPRQLFIDAKGFWEQLGAGVEDGEFGLRLARMGAVFSLDKDLLGFHNPHEITGERTKDLRKYVDMINLRHFGSTEPNYGLIEASKETYEQWKISWTPPESWSK